MGRGNRQTSPTIIEMFVSDAFNIFYFTQDQSGNPNNRLPGRRNIRKMFAAALKYLYAKLVFKQADLFADTGLRSE